MKFDPQAIPDLPAPRPAYEIWVYSPRVEGVHLRFGKVARGGLRWSDRREDFRTEILGLVKAQMVKNTVIVPVGAKGGFVAKQLPDPSVDRDAWLAEGIACYKIFISGAARHHRQPGRRRGRAAGRRRPPRRGRHLPGRRRRQGHRDVLRHRQRGRRVATASGSATPSPPAARPATTTRAWASPPAAPGSRSSGTSASWATTPRPRTSPSSASATCPVTCSATACCSREHIRLVAAFDHRHIFIDPNPDAATSYAERRRLFELPRSSWADYDTELISAGGGVYPRTAKSIPINAADARRRSASRPRSPR